VAEALRNAVRGVAVLVFGACLYMLVMNIREMEELSHVVVSETTEQSKMRGALVHQPFVPESSFAAMGTTYRVTDLFVEQATHEEYRYFILKSLVRDSAWRLVVAISPAPSDKNFAGQLLKGFGPDSTAEVQERKSADGRRSLFIANVHRPFPDTISFRVDTAFTRPR
jgi:hypothetical protein